MKLYHYKSLSQSYYYFKYRARPSIEMVIGLNKWFNYDGDTLCINECYCDINNIDQLKDLGHTIKCKEGIMFNIGL